jgi:hypothetical protein
MACTCSKTAQIASAQFAAAQFIGTRMQEACNSPGLEGKILKKKQQGDKEQTHLYQQGKTREASNAGRLTNFSQMRHLLT